MAAILLLIACILPVGSEPARCDRIELNRVYNDDGQLWLEQVIFWRWEPAVGWACEGWRRLDHGRLRKTPHGWRWEEPRHATIEAPVMRQTWTQYDREVENHEVWPIERRKLDRFGDRGGPH